MSMEKIADELRALPAVQKLLTAAALLDAGGDKRIVTHLIQMVELELRLGGPKP